MKNPIIDSIHRLQTGIEQLVYGASTDNSQIRYDKNRSVKDWVIEFNTPSKDRVRDLSFRFTQLVHSIQSTSSINNTHPAFPFLRLGFDNLENLTKAISANDYYLGDGEELIVQRSGQRSPKRTDLIQDKSRQIGIINKVVSDENGLDFSALTEKEKSIFSNLILFACKIGRTSMEELNRMRDVKNTPFVLARRISKVEENLGRPIIIGTDWTILGELNNFSFFEDEMLESNDLSVLRLIEGRRFDLYTPTKELTPDNTEISRVFSDVAERSELDLYSESDLQYAIERHGVNALLSKLILKATDEIGDEVIILSKMHSGEPQIEDKLIGFGVVFGIPYRFDYEFGIGKDGIIEAKRSENHLTRLDGDNKATKKSWRRNTTDLPLSEGISDKLLEMRRKGMEIEAKIHKGSDLTGEELAHVDRFAMFLSDRLLATNINKGIRGTQIGIKELELGWHSSFDIKELMNNPAHAQGGIQHFVRMPFVSGNMRAWNESNKPEAQMTPQTVRKVVTYRAVAEQIFNRGIVTPNLN